MQEKAAHSGRREGKLWDILQLLTLHFLII